MKTLKYKDYEGTCEIDAEEEICYGKLLFIDDLITYEAEIPKQLRQEFEAAVDDYIETCAELGIEAKKPLKGQFNVRVTPELHKEAILRSYNDDVSLNEIVKRALEAYLYASHDVTNPFNISIAGQQNPVISSIPTAEPQWFNMPTNTADAPYARH